MNDTTIYSNNYIFKKEFPQYQTKDYLVLYPDFTYEQIRLTGSIDDRFENYKSWEKEIKTGNWELNKNNILTLTFGDFKTQYRKRKKCIRYKRFQKANDGSKLNYNKWILERKIKYKIENDKTSLQQQLY